MDENTTIQKCKSPGSQQNTKEGLGTQEKILKQIVNTNPQAQQDIKKEDEEIDINNNTLNSA